jgi:tetratricopeptide (TPR) repeat protein
VALPEYQRGICQFIAANCLLVIRDNADIWSEMYALCLGEGYWLAGAYDQAKQTLAGVLDIARRCGMRFALGSAHRLLGEVALHTSPAEAPSYFEQSIAILHAIHADNELALAYAGYGRWHAQYGDLARVRDYLAQALALFERLGTLGEPDKVR